MAKLSTLSAGTTFTFAGKQVILLDSATGLVFFKDKIADRAYDASNNNTYLFNPNSTTNIGYYLNSIYYNTLTENEKASILTNEWLLNAQSGTSTIPKVICKISLIRAEEWQLYSVAWNQRKLILNPTTQMWTRSNTTTNGVQSVKTDGNFETSAMTQVLAVHPVMRLDSNLDIVNGTVVYNSAPVLNVTTPSTNQTLYENDMLNIAGTVSDADNGNTVTIRYQIGAGTARAIKAFVSTGATESFSKQLRFSGGNLYDGDTLIASNLTDGVPHTLKVWATDDQGGTSTITERTFYVVPNRAPSLSVNTPVISGNIDNDEFEITGSFNDLDKNTTKVVYRINGGSSVQVAEGTGGDFNFKVKFGQLKVGLNTIAIEAIDSYGAKTSRTVQLNKNEVKTEQLKSTARFKIHPPLNTATGIVLWVRRNETLDLSASISMTQAAEAENFVQMANPRTAPLANTPGIVEDQFEYESATAAEKIILQLDMQRSSLTANEKIYLLVGVID